MRKKYKSKRTCFYHLCRKRTDVYKCKYCEKFFCKENLKPKPPGLPNFEFLSNTRDRIFMREWQKSGGHPCIPYFYYLEAKNKRNEKKHEKALDKLLMSKPFELDKLPKPKPSEFESNKLDIKSILIILGLSILLLFYLFIWPDVNLKNYTPYIESKIESIKFSVFDYPEFKEIELISVDYPFLLENPIIDLPVKFFINESEINYSYAVFYPEMINDTIDGFKKWETATDGLIKFQRTNNKNESNVLVEFNRSLGNTTIYSGEGGITATWKSGEGGPIDYIEHRNYSIITKSQISIIPSRQKRCYTIDTATHEMGHALGLGHDNFFGSIMYWRPYPCFTHIANETANVLNKLYKNSKSDLRFKTANAEKNSGFDISVEIINVGLRSSEPVTLQIYDGAFFRAKKIISKLKPTESLKLDFKNLNMTLKNEIIHILIDIENKEQEINENDNEVKLRSF